MGHQGITATGLAVPPLAGILEIGTSPIVIAMISLVPEQKDQTHTIVSLVL
jgi:hypothetical protein